MQILIRLSAAWALLLVILYPALANGQNPAPVERLTYEVQEGDRTPLLTRIWVSAEMMREDNGDDGGYVLFDRRDKTVYSINRDEHTVLIVPLAGKRATLTGAPQLNLLQLPGGQAPEISGRKPQHWQLRLGDQICQEGWVVPGLMRESVEAMSEYRSALARQHRLTLDLIPEAYRDLCDDAVQVFAPTALLDKGLPLESWDAKGVVWRLTGYEIVEDVPQALFERPEDYEVMTMPGQVMPQSSAPAPASIPAE
ncbi:MAG: hypothetical protein ABW076_08385 [Candidatus Thiodiazotropha sp.]